MTDLLNYSARVIADSLGPNGARLTTLLVTYPRFCHADMLRHRLFSRSVGSSRAIPAEKLLDQVEANPAYPVFWGKNQPGMQAEEELPGEVLQMCKDTWNDARRDAISHARVLSRLGLHKQLVNRIIEPFMWVTEVISATEWENFDALRANDTAAQPEVQHIARKMKGARALSTPTVLKVGEWHLPFITQSTETVEEHNDVTEALKLLGTSAVPTNLQTATDILKCVSAARCARTSYLTHEGRRDMVKDLELFSRLMLRDADGKPVHASPVEHVAQACAGEKVWSGNFLGFYQWRKSFESERVGPAPGDRWHGPCTK